MVAVTAVTLAVTECVPMKPSVCVSSVAVCAIINMSDMISFKFIPAYRARIIPSDALNHTPHAKRMSAFRDTDVDIL